MNLEDNLFAIALVTIPSVLLYFAFWFTIRKFFQENEKKRTLAYRKKVSKEILNVRLQATERLILLLERITPGALALRVDHNQLRVAQYQQLLIKSIRSEFDHNLSQQIYVSEKTWQIIVVSKESIIKLINDSCAELRPDLPAIELGRKLIENYGSIKETPIDLAKKAIKQEIRQLF